MGMTREDAILCLKGIKNYGRDTFTEQSDWQESLDLAIKALEQEPTTKNDLGVDLISREQALVAIRNLYPGMPRVDFNGSLRKWVDKYKPYIECDDAIKQLPSVTPQEQKTGHWIVAKGGSYLGMRNGCCSNCKDFYTNDWNVMNYCPHCGAKMVEPQESEVDNGNDD